jgi:septum formation protein
LAPEIASSTFEEDLPVHEFPDVHEYPVATATHKAVEVYERLVVRLSHHPHTNQSFNLSSIQREDPENGPDLVIAADTVVLTNPATSASSNFSPFNREGGPNQEVIEKPTDKQDHLRILLDLNGAVCEVVTGVTVGEWDIVSTVLCVGLILDRGHSLSDHISTRV